MEPYEIEDRRQMAMDAQIRNRPCCEDCGRVIQTRYCLDLDSYYLCWNCVTDRRKATAEEFDQEGFEWD